MPLNRTAGFRAAIEAIMANKLRSLLTTLGINFGVAAVITMLAIGKGTERQILDQLKLVGVNNITVTPVIKQEEDKVDQEQGTGTEKEKFSPGLTLLDAEGIRDVVPGVDRISPEIILNMNLIHGGIRRTARLVGVTPTFFDMTGFSLERGRMFSRDQLVAGLPVCIIGKNIKTRFFPSEDPIGKYLKCGKVWLRIIGVLQERLISDDAASHLGIRNYNMDVYTPMETVLIRYRNRGMLTKAALERAANPWGNDDETTKDPLNAKDNHNQIDRLVIQVNSTDELKGAADVISRLLERRHNGVVDFEVVIPELMLRQEQETKKMFRNVLAAIAGISLLIGGIGIMNIMLASVLERTKEIGLRLSIGATKDDVVMQFLMESVTISLVGGLSGIILGIGLSVLIDVGFGIATVISPVSVFLSFFISAMVGLIFGIAPARRAAMQDPIKSLRYE